MRGALRVGRVIGVALGVVDCGGPSDRRMSAPCGSQPGGQQMSAKCPRCGLISPDATLRCDCGYSFETGLPAPERGFRRHSKLLAKAAAVILGVLAGFYSFLEGVRGLFVFHGGIVSFVLALVVLLPFLLLLPLSIVAAFQPRSAAYGMLGFGAIELVALVAGLIAERHTLEVSAATLPVVLLYPGLPCLLGALLYYASSPRNHTPSVSDSR